MADQAEPVPTPPEDDPFNIEPPAPVQEAAPKEDRPRNPDGTFAKQEPDAPTHPSYLIEAAKEAGFDDNEIASIPTDQLHAQVHRAQRAARLAQQQEREAFARIHGQERPQQPREQAPPPEPDDNLVIDELEKEGYDPRLMKTMRKLIARNKELETIKSEIGNVAHRERERSVTTNTEKIEAAFESLGPDFHVYFGDGAASEMANGSPELRRRRMMLADAGINFDKDSVQAIKKKIKAAAEIAYGPVLNKKKPVEEVPDPYAGVVKSSKTNGQRFTNEEWDAAAVARPTHRDNAELPLGDERAIRNLAKKMGKTADLSGQVQQQEDL